MIEALNILTFAVGVVVTMFAVGYVVRHSRNPTGGIAGRVVCLFAIDNILDDTCTLIFAANVVKNTLAASGGNPNHISEAVAICLRLAIFLGSGYAMAKSRQLINEDSNEFRQLLIRAKKECRA